MTPEQEDEVRRALASLPAAGPVPPEVAARLDATLAELVSEREAGDGPAGGRADTREAAEGSTGEPVGDDLARRRARRWPRLLVAAATIAVVGVGVGSVLDDLGQGAADQSTATRAGDSAEGEAAAPDSAPSASAKSGARQPETLDGLATDDHAPAFVAADKPVRLHRATLDRDVARVSATGQSLSAAKAQSDSPRERGLLERRTARLFAACDLPAAANGDRLVAARLDGARATLVLRHPQDGRQVAEIYACDGRDDLLAATTIDAQR